MSGTEIADAGRRAQVEALPNRGPTTLSPYAPLAGVRVCCYALPMRCPVLRLRMVVPGNRGKIAPTDSGSSPIRDLGTVLGDVRYWPSVWRYQPTRCTDVLGQAKSQVPQAPEADKVSAYALATRCPELTYRSVVSAYALTVQCPVLSYAGLCDVRYWPSVSLSSACCAVRCPGLT
eukprot:3383922-Rhodomonas_salina.3